MLYPPYKSTEPPREPFVQKYLPWLMLGTLTVLSLTVIALVKKAGHATAPPSPKAATPATALRRLTQDALADALPGLTNPTTVPPPPSWAWFTPELQAHCREILRGYSASPAWRSKLPLVRDATRVGPLMRAFYEQDHLQDPTMREPVILESCLVQNHPVVRALFAGRRSDLDTPLEAAFVADHDGSYRLDWESFVGAGEMTWPAFCAQRPARPVLLRGIAKADTYFNYEFGDEAKYRSFRIYSPDGEMSVNAYCAKNSAAERAIQSPANLNSQTFLMPVTVRLAFPANAKSDHCVALIEVVAKGWLLP